MKSPPELWAELSDPASLARHLGELSGEITITRIEPETTVVWEGERATGRVELAPSGWGTKVTLTVAAAGPPRGSQGGDDAPATPQAGAADGEGHADGAAEARAPQTRAASAPAATSAPAPAQAPAPTAASSPPAPAQAPTPTAAASPPAPAQAPAPTAAASPPAPSDSPTPAAATSTVEAEDDPPVEARIDDGTRRRLEAPEPSGATDTAPAGTGVPAAPAPIAGVTITEAPQSDDHGLAARSTAAGAPLPAKRGFFARLFGRRRHDDASDGDRLATASAQVARPGSPAEATPTGSAPDTALPDPIHDATPAEATPTGSAPDTALPDPIHDATPADSAPDADPAVPPLADPAPDADPAVPPLADPAPDADPAVPPLADRIPGAAQTDLAPDAAHTDPIPDTAPDPTTADATRPDPAPDVAMAVGASADLVPAGPADAPPADGLDPERASALLVAALDALGAAHHRPFSRG